MRATDYVPVFMVLLFWQLGKMKMACENDYLEPISTVFTKVK